MKIAKIIGVALLSIGLSSATAEPQAPTQISEILSSETINVNRQAQKSRGAAVRVVTAFGHGSGTYVKVGKFYGIITAAHVVEGSNLVIVDTNGRQRIAVPVWASQQDDLAFLWMPDNMKGKKALKLKNNSRVQAGDEVIYSGYPSVHELLTFKCSIANSDNPGYILVQGFGWFGASGSGFVDENSNVFAVLSAVTVEDFYGHPQVISAIVVARMITKQHIADIESVLQTLESQH